MPGPLNGLRVLDLTWVLSGPYASMILSDLGAEVIKVERPPHGDVARTTGPFVANESIYFQSINRGKRSLCLDLQRAEGTALFFELVDKVDIVMENFTPGVMERLGLGYAALAARNPRLIYASTSGFGQTGPLREKAALDIVVQGMGGAMSITGYPDGPPARPGMSLGDIAAGLYTAIGRAGGATGTGTERAGPVCGRQHAGLPDCGAGERGGALLRDGAGAAAAGDAASFGDAVSGVSDGGRLAGAGAGMGDRESVGAVVLGDRSGGVDR